MMQVELQEPLIESAPLAHRSAQTLCLRASDPGDGCAWYHGFWQYLRVMGLAKTSGGQGVFLVAALRARIQSDAAVRVLVSGSADYSMPAHVLFAFASEHATPDLTVLDRCETPLYLSRWYAERVAAPIATVRSDILAYRAATPFDVVLTNSFLGNFDAPSRPRLMSAWHRLLRPGGSVLFTNRLRPNADASPVTFTTKQTEDFCEAVRREAKRWQPAFGFDVEAVSTWARTYAERFRSYPLRSADEIVSLLRDGGFSVDDVNVVSAPPRPVGGPLSGPSLAENADYVQVRATRR
jgi:SAM-dependent methyltransferase